MPEAYRKWYAFVMSNNYDFPELPEGYRWNVKTCIFCDHIHFCIERKGWLFWYKIGETLYSRHTLAGFNGAYLVNQSLRRLAQNPQTIGQRAAEREREDKRRKKEQDKSIPWGTH